MEDFLLGKGVFLYVSVHSIIVLRDGQGLVQFSPIGISISIF